MRAVCIEEPAAVSSEFFDELLRGHRALRDGLFRDGLRRSFAVSAGGGDLEWLHEFHGVVGLKVLYYAFGDQNQGTHNAEGQQNPQAAPNQVDPEIANGLHLAPSDAADEGDGECDAGRR